MRRSYRPPPTLVPGATGATHSLLQEEHHVEYFGASMSYGKMKHADVMRSMELFARDVMPKFR